MTPLPFHIKIKQLRRKAGLSQREAAIVSGLKRRNIEEWEQQRYEPRAFVKRMYIELLKHAHTLRIAKP